MTVSDWLTVVILINYYIITVEKVPYEKKPASVEINKKPHIFTIRGHITYLSSIYSYCFLFHNVPFILFFNLTTSELHRGGLPLRVDYNPQSRDKHSRFNFLLSIQIISLSPLPMYLFSCFCNKSVVNFTRETNIIVN